MPARTTLLLLTPDLVARCDQTSGGAVKIASQPRPPGDDLATALERARGLGDEVRGNVWVLTPEVHVQRVRVRSAQLKGLDRASVDRLVAYEAQTLSGIAPQDAALAWRGRDTSDGSRELQVAELPLADRNEIVGVVEGFGARLAGIVHPAGLPAPLDPAARKGAWRRVEYWPDLVADVRGNGSAATLDVTRTDPNRWTDPVGSPAPTETLVASRAMNAGGLGSVVMNVRGQGGATLTEPDDLARWLEAWAAVLARGTPPTPALVPPKRPVPKAVWVLVALLLAVGTGALCWWLDGKARARIADLKAERERLLAPTELLRQVKAGVARKQAGVKTLESAVRDAERARDTEAVARRLPAMALRLIAQGMPEGAWLEEIDLDGGLVVLRGRSASPHAADQVASWIEPRLVQEKVAVHVPAQKRDDDGTYAFEIHVVSAVVPTSGAARVLSPVTGTHALEGGR